MPLKPAGRALIVAQQRPQRYPDHRLMPCVLRFFARFPPCRTLRAACGRRVAGRRSPREFAQLAEVFVKRPTLKPSMTQSLVALAGLTALAGTLAWLTPHSAAQNPTPALPPQPVVVLRPPAPAAPPVLQASEIKTAQPGPDGRLVLPRANHPQPTTLQDDLQRAVGDQLAKTGLPYGAVVLLDPRTGAVLAMAETRDAADPVGAIGDLTRPTVPAASVFKIVTAAALLESGHSADLKACFHGGLHGLDASHLVERAGDKRCETLTEALARSSNAAFARFALRDLQPGQLAKMANAFGFNHTLPGDVAVEPSPFAEATLPLERARNAAGFAGSQLSPLHAAWLAAVVASDGHVPRISALGLGDPSKMGLPSPPPISEATARTLRTMMVQTTAVGTGRRAFSTRPVALRGIDVGGKTGSLSAPEGEMFRHVSWFVGFAPADHPQVAVAALAINGWKWKVKAPALARDALGAYFEKAGARTAFEIPEPAAEQPEVPPPGVIGPTEAGRMVPHHGAPLASRGLDGARHHG